ncbi:hypothetical protein KY366_03780 [Candidatus Woesearchaeota archaeon]|nr:hypothetical protein [Candidatus Woesearchaeota archaeon]
MKIRVGELNSEKNKNTKEETIYDNLGRDAIYTYFSNEGKQYQIYCHGLNEISRDKRKSSIEITHKLNDGTKHEIRLVADFKHSFKGQLGFHLNLTEDSKRVMSKCEECKKYFTHFNHFSIFPEKGKGINITDADSIFNQIREKIRQSLLPNYKLSSSKNLLFNSKD